jgi:hypothetical protein
MLSSRSTKTLALVTYVGLVCSLGCITLVDDLAEGAGDAETSSGDGEAGSGDGDGDGDPGETGDTGEPCMPFETTEVMGCAEIVGEGFCSEGGGHVDIGTQIEWMHEPPHSGKHYPVWSSAGEKDEPVERGFWVHNLEHGWIVLVYNCPDGCDAELARLREVLDARPDLDILLTPDPLLGGSRFAAISWTWVYAFEDPVVDQLLCFVDQHYDHSPETVH